MVAKTWFATNNLAGPAHQEMSETDPGAEAYASPVTGWVVGTGATNHGAFNSQTEATSFPDTTAPDGSIDTTNGDCLRSTDPLTGSFASANWNVHFACRANTNGGAQDGRMRCRLFRGANADGSGATEITAAQQQGGLVTNLATAATQVSTATFNPGAFSVSNEFIFVQLAWERTGAGGMATADVNMRVGNGSGTGTRVISSDFTPSAVTEERDLTSAGSATVTVAGASVIGKDLSSAGTGAATFNGAPIEARDLTSVGAATVTFDGADAGQPVLEERDLSSAGTASVSFAAAGVLGKDLSASGTSAASFSGAAVLGKDLNTTGSAAASFNSATVLDRELAATGQAAVSFDGEDAGAASIEARDLTAVGAAAAAFQATTIEARSLSSQGTATVSFEPVGQTDESPPFVYVPVTNSPVPRPPFVAASARAEGNAANARSATRASRSRRNYQPAEPRP